MNRLARLRHFFDAYDPIGKKHLQALLHASEEKLTVFVFS